MFANLMVPSCTFPLSMVLHGQLCKLAGGMRERDTSHLPTPCCVAIGDVASLTSYLCLLLNAV